MGQALNAALDCIGDTFRPERKEHEARIGTACRLRSLVLSHRYTFQQALDVLEARTDWMLESFEWMALDNVALSIKHDHDFHMLNVEAETWRWLKQISGQK